MDPGSIRRAAMFVALPAVLFAVPAVADDLTFRGMVATDFRAGVEGDDRGDLIWNLNTADLTLKQRLNPHIRYELNLRVNFDGLAFAGTDGGHDLSALTNVAVMDPFWLESDAAYVSIRNIFDGFDIVFGRQIVTWGAADRFRPTNNLNPDDVWDPTRFGITQANEMVRFLYNPVGDLMLEAVVVPIFRPARVPASGAAALTDPKYPVPFLEEETSRMLINLRDNVLPGLGVDWGDTTATAEPPGLSLENIQVGARVSWRGEESDWSLSYYYGFDDFPHTMQVDASIIPATPETRAVLNSAVTLVYPRIHVGGFDVAGQIPFLDDAGFRFEGAVVWPEEIDCAMNLPTGFGRLEGHSISGKPFFRATLGLDYTFTRDIFGLVMIVHGMQDELGSQAVGDFATSTVGDYAVVGLDFKFFNSKLLLRLFGIVAIDPDYPSGVIYPMLQWNPWSSMELEAGGLVMLGGSQSKFGQQAAGGSMVFLRSRVRF